MPEEYQFTYQPIIAAPDGTLSAESYMHYLEQSPLTSVLEALVIDPFETALHAKGAAQHTFGDFRVSVANHSQKSTSWKTALTKFTTYLEIRADDSRAKEFEGIGYFEGVGYCIRAQELKQTIENLITDNTTSSTALQSTWPKISKDAPPLRILTVPLRTPNHYQTISEENARIALNARKFMHSLKKEVINAFKDANKTWHKKETGYDDEKNIPPVDASPITRFNYAGDHLIVVRLVTVPKPAYQDIITLTRQALTEIIEGRQPGDYELRGTRDDKNEVVLNIKSVNDFLKKKIEKPEIETRYDIIP